MNMQNEVNARLNRMVGETIESVSGNRQDDEFVVRTTSGLVFTFYHNQDCCEEVYLEEIIGDIQDEFDQDEIPEIQEIAKDHYIFDSKMLLAEVNDILDTDIEDDDIDTIGGWFMTQHFDVEEGDTIEYDGYCFKVTEQDGHHILYLEVTKLSPSDTQDEE